MEYKITTLDERPDLFDQVIDLIETSFSYNKANRYQDDFYPLMSSDNHKNNIIIEYKNQVVAHVGVLKKMIQKKSDSFPISLLGGICTHPNFRGQGLLSLVLDFIFEKYKSKTTFYLLWSDLSSLYEKYNFYEAGGILQTGQKDIPLNLDNYTKLKLKDISDDDLKDISFIYDTFLIDNYFSIQRSLKDWEKLKRITSADLYIKRKKESISSYFFINKGQDLSNIIHEFGTVLDPSNEITQLKDFKLWLPEVFKNKYPTENLLFTGFFKIGNESLFSDFVEIWTGGEIKIESIQNSQINFTFEEDEFGLHTKEFLISLFGPYKLKEFEDFNNHFYISGLDSI